MSGQRSGQSARQLFENFEELRGVRVASFPAKPIRRPYGGWGAREWRRKALNGPIAAFWVVSVWTWLVLATAILDLLAELGRS